MGQLNTHLVEIKKSVIEETKSRPVSRRFDVCVETGCLNKFQNKPSQEFIIPYGDGIESTSSSKFTTDDSSSKLKTIEEQTDETSGTYNDTKEGEVPYVPPKNFYTSVEIQVDMDLPPGPSKCTLCPPIILEEPKHVTIGKEISVQTGVTDADPTEEESNHKIIIDDDDTNSEKPKDDIIELKKKSSSRVVIAESVEIIPDTTISEGVDITTEENKFQIQLLPPISIGSALKVTKTLELSINNNGLSVNAVDDNTNVGYYEIVSENWEDDKNEVLATRIYPSTQIKTRDSELSVHEKPILRMPSCGCLQKRQNSEPCKCEFVENEILDVTNVKSNKNNTCACNTGVNMNNLNSVLLDNMNKMFEAKENMHKFNNGRKVKAGDFYHYSNTKSSTANSTSADPTVNTENILDLYKSYQLVGPGKNHDPDPLSRESTYKLIEIDDKIYKSFVNPKGLNYLVPSDGPVDVTSSQRIYHGKYENGVVAISSDGEVSDVNIPESKSKKTRKPDVSKEVPKGFYVCQASQCNLVIDQCLNKRKQSLNEQESKSIDAENRGVILKKDYIQEMENRMCSMLTGRMMKKNPSISGKRKTNKPRSSLTNKDTFREGEVIEKTASQSGFSLGNVINELNEKVSNITTKETEIVSIRLEEPATNKNIVSVKVSPERDFETQSVGATFPSTRESHVPPKASTQTTNEEESQLIYKKQKSERDAIIKILNNDDIVDAAKADSRSIVGNRESVNMNKKISVSKVEKNPSKESYIREKIDNKLNMIQQNLKSDESVEVDEISISISYSTEETISDKEITTVTRPQPEIKLDVIIIENLPPSGPKQAKDKEDQHDKKLPEVPVEMKEVPKKTSSTDSIGYIKCFKYTKHKADYDDTSLQTLSDETLINIENLEDEKKMEGDQLIDLQNSELPRLFKKALEDSNREKDVRNSGNADFTKKVETFTKVLTEPQSSSAVPKTVSSVIESMKLSASGTIDFNYNTLVVKDESVQRTAKLKKVSTKQSVQVKNYMTLIGDQNYENIPEKYSKTPTQSSSSKHERKSKEKKIDIPRNRGDQRNKSSIDKILEQPIRKRGTPKLKSLFISNKSLNSSTSESYSQNKKIKKHGKIKVPDVVAEKLSDGEKICSCSVSSGEFHVCSSISPFRQKHREQLKNSEINVQNHRAFYNNWISYYIKDKYIRSPSASSISKQQ